MAILSPEAIERAEAVKENAAVPGSIRWIPPFLSLTSAISNSRKNQTLNTPAISTLVLMESQIRYLNGQRRSRLGRQAMRALCEHRVFLGRGEPLCEPVRCG